ncbi:RPM1 interacting protein 13 isoform X2 [Euphorbia lathyris]|uniref:RPM1 interacting protein 13 isoform X2 n=1 Tax=Euphorbia lathyris TaxID=212925 RepID=UPI003313B68B
MDFNPVIFDISSDEEPTFDEPRGGDDDHEWLTELLQTVGRETADSDGDDVVVLSEYVPPKPKSKSKSKPSRVVKDLDDDDCVVLEGDPDKAVNVADDAADDADDADDVLVVGQTGQIACRDYPHPRHLCAKFRFSSTPHEQHCNLCHCYVCDSLAPCSHWGNGTSTINHCHATDKQEMWKIQRHESFRLKKSASLPVLKFPEAQHPVAVPQLNQAAVLDKGLAPIGRHNEVCRPTATHTISSTRLNVPNIISQNRNLRHVYMQGRNGFTPSSVPQQALGIRGSAILQNRGQQLVSNNTTFKRPGLVRSALKNQSVYGSSNMNFPRASQYVRNTVPVAGTNVGNSAGWQDGLPDIISASYMHPSLTQPETGSVSVNTVVQPEVCSVPITHSNNDQNINHLGNQGQNVVDSPFSDFDFGWINNLDPSNQQTSVDIIHPQAIGSNNEPTADIQFTSQLPGSTEHDHDYASWLRGQSDGLASEGCVPGDLFSPVPSAAFDAGLRQDLEKDQTTVD